jgi:hypothetical protein
VRSLGEPRLLRRPPDSRGRHPPAIVPIYFCGSSRNCGRSHHLHRRKDSMGRVRVINRREECVRMPGKTVRSEPRTPLGRSGVTATGRSSNLGFQAVQNRSTFHFSSGSSGGIPNWWKGKGIGVQVKNFAGHLHRATRDRVVDVECKRCRFR